MQKDVETNQKLTKKERKRKNIEEKERRMQEESGVWRNYFRLIFKTKLPVAWIGLLVVLNLVQVNLSLAFPQFTEKIMAGVLTNPIIFGAVAVIVGDIVMSGIIRYISSVTRFKIDMSYRRLIWKRLMKSPIQLFDEVKPSEMVSRAANDTSTLSAVIAGILPSIISLIYSSFYIIVVLAKYDWRLSLGLLVYTPIYVISIVWYGKWNFRANKRIYNRLASLTQFLSELLVNIPLIKSFATEEKENKRGREKLQEYYHASMRNSIINWINVPLNSILWLIMDLFVIIFGIYLISANVIPLSSWISFFMYVGMYLGILESFATIYIQLKQSQGSTVRIAQLVEGKLEVYDGEKKVEKAHQDLVFEHVNFGYSTETGTVLEDVSMTIPYGKTTALIGPSGSGKSTLLTLIQQLYQPDKGKILFGGSDISEYNLVEWRNLFSYVAQESPLFDGTIRENILYGVDGNVTEEQLIHAAKLANAYEFIQNSSEGFETSVGEGGSNLSGGQRQRIAIARAVLRDADILLLDEVTASLDGQSEQVIQEALQKLMRDKTTIVVAHDLSTVIESHQIILINEEGTVDAIGNHQELLEKSSLYRQIIEYLAYSSSQPNISM